MVNFGRDLQIGLEVWGADGTEVTPEIARDGEDEAKIGLSECSKITRKWSDFVDF